MEYILSRLIMDQLGGKGNPDEDKWNSLSFYGLIFPTEYHYHKIPLIYYDNLKRKEFILNKTAEEYALLFSKYIDTEYIKFNIFRKNFWKDWKKILKNDEIVDFNHCDFSNFIKHYENTRQNKVKEEYDEKYKYAQVNGKTELISYKVEPPGIFLGRGGCDNPLLGKLKKRLYPEDFTINISEDAAIPIHNVPEHNWGNIIHDKHVEWLCSWRDNVTGKIKYIWLSQHSELRQSHDKDKFELARKLKKIINKIREVNNKNISSPDIKTRQLATALYLIDEYALRVGNEKGSDDTDTVGCLSLRVEHVHIKDGKVTLDFLGKDSIRYKNEFKPPSDIYNNLLLFSENKNKTDVIFDYILPYDLNKYVQDFMPELTAKVFRTFSASNLFQEELKKISEQFKNYDKDDKINVITDAFNHANIKVAKHCNHQKAVSKTFNSQIDKFNDQLKTVKSKLDSAHNKKKIKEQIKKIKMKKKLKIELKTVSLGTSKVNYIDPRIIISFIKKHNLPIDKIFPKSMQEKFKWAMDTDENFKF